MFSFRGSLQFKEKAAEADRLMGALDDEVQVKAENEVAALDSGGSQEERYIRTTFVKKVVSYALAPHLGEKRAPRYYWDASTGRQECDEMVIAHGVPAQDLHRELIDTCQKDERVAKIASLIIALRSLRDQIPQRIDRCLYNREYVSHVCPRCPARQTFGISN